MPHKQLIKILALFSGYLELEVADDDFASCSVAVGESLDTGELGRESALSM